MPTYACSVPPGKLDESQKSEIAKCISSRHSEATGAPLFFVQVVIEESRADRYLGGQKARIISGFAATFVPEGLRRSAAK